MARVKWPGSTSSPIGASGRQGMKKRRLQVTQIFPYADLLSDYSNLRKRVSMNAPAKFDLHAYTHADAEKGVKTRRSSVL